MRSGAGRQRTSRGGASGPFCRGTQRGDLSGSRRPRGPGGVSCGGERCAPRRDRRLQVGWLAASLAARARRARADDHSQLQSRDDPGGILDGGSSRPAAVAAARRGDCRFAVSDQGRPSRVVRGHQRGRFRAVAAPMAPESQRPGGAAHFPGTPSGGWRCRPT